MGTRKFVDI